MLKRMNKVILLLVVVVVIILIMFVNVVDYKKIDF